MVKDSECIQSKTASSPQFQQETNKQAKYSSTQEILRTCNMRGMVKILGTPFVMHVLLVLRVLVYFACILMMLL